MAFAGKPIKVGVIGLGAGSLAVYAGPDRAALIQMAAGTRE